MAMYPSGDVREILYGTYNPLSEDCLSEEFCAQQLTMTETVTPQFDPYYNIRYSHPETSRRVKYLKKLIHNASIEYLNSQIQDLSDHNRKEIAYSLKVIKRDTISVLKRATEIIDEHGLSLSALDAKGISFAKDLPYYESIYIFNYIVATAMYIFVEFQEQFKDYLQPEKMMTLEELFTIEMKVAVPENIPVERIEHKPKEVEAQSGVDTVRVKTPIEIKTEEMMATLRQYGFYEMAKVKDLTDQLKYDLTYLMTTKGAPYAIAMLHYLGYYTQLQNVYSMTKEASHRHVGSLLGISSRRAKGYRNILNPDSTEDPSVYTSCQHVDEVKKDYQNLLVSH